MDQSRIPIPIIYILLFSQLLFVSSCTVTNGLYINDPMPFSPDMHEIYLGGGMGLAPVVEEIDSNGEVEFKRLSRSYFLSGGIRTGLAKNLSLHGSVHLPEIVGGIGLSVRPQYSFFPAELPFNMAFAVEMGGVVTDFWDEESKLGNINPETKGALNADISLPACISFSPKTRLIFTPRYSFNNYYIRKADDLRASKRIYARYPVVSVGLRTGRLHFEASGLRYDNQYTFVAGVAIFVKTGEN